MITNMHEKLNISQKNLEQALHKLSLLIDKAVKKKPDTTDAKLQHLIRLNTELEKDNLALKEELFTASTNLNTLKEQNKKAYNNIDEVISSLEKMTG